MIGIYINPDCTQIVKGKLNKNNILKVDFMTKLPSYWHELKTLEIYPETGLARLFHELKRNTKTRYEEIYIVLADTIFSMISCYPYITEDKLQVNIQDALGISAEELKKKYFVVAPIEVKPSFQTRKSVYVIEQVYITRLVEAAKLAKLSITSIEPASMAFIRCRREWEKDYPVMEIFEEESSIFRFSPYAGIYCSEPLDLTSNQLMRDEAAAETIILNAVTQNQYLSGKSFYSYTPDAKYSVLCSNFRVLNLTGIKQVKETEKITLPEFVDTSLKVSMQVDGLIVIGTLLQNYPDEEAVYAKKHPSVVVTSANLLPEELQKEAKNTHWRGIASRSLSVMTGILALTVVVEMAGMIYFSHITVPDELEADYQAAQASKSEIDAEISAIKAARTENMQVMEAYKELLANRPNGLGFVDLTIGSSNPDNKAAKENYVKLKATSLAQTSFNEMITNLETDSFFVSPVLNSMNKAGDAAMTADISIGKGGR